MKNKRSEASLGPYQTIMIVTRRKNAAPPKMVSAQSKNENSIQLSTFIRLKHSSSHFTFFFNFTSFTLSEGKVEVPAMTMEVFSQMERSQLSLLNYWKHTHS